MIVSYVHLRSGNGWSFNVGHKLHPEVFSTWPDLSQWSDLDDHLGAYASQWSRIVLCRVHAAAVNNAPCPHPYRARQVTWELREVWHVRCQVMLDSPLDSVQMDDLVILRCLGPDSEVLLYGRCWKTEYTSPKALSLLVQLSEIGSFIRDQQAAAVESAETFNVQFISVPSNEKKMVSLIEGLPKTRLLSGVNLTAFSMQKKKEKELRPLVPSDQVEKVVRRPQFTMKSSMGLNGQQTMAVQRGLQRPFSTVQGPPGTGKTSFVVNLIALNLSLEMKPNFAYEPRRWNGRGEPYRLLVLAPSNHAVDEMVRRLKQETDIPDEYITRIYSRSIERADGSTCKGSPQIRHDVFDVKEDVCEHALHRKLSSTCFSFKDQPGFNAKYEEAELQILRKSRVVVTTVTNSYLHTSLNKMDPQSQWRRPIKFSTVIVDEAAQASEPDVVVSFLQAAYRVVVVGDHKQLGPVVPEGNLCTPYIHALEMPFLERMLRNPTRQMTSTILNEQYRMRPSIRQFPSDQFYDSLLQDRVSIQHRRELGELWPNKDDHVTFIDCDARESFAISSDGTRSLKNCGEGKLLVEVCRKLLNNKCAPSDIAILTPYNGQVAEIRRRMADHFPQAHSVLIGTVHAMQGAEREQLGCKLQVPIHLARQSKLCGSLLCMSSAKPRYIIISCVRSLPEDVGDIQSPTLAAQASLGQNKALREISSYQIGILGNPRLLNVSLTRARYGLVCVGNRPESKRRHKKTLHSLQ